MDYASKDERVGELRGQLGHRNALDMWRLTLLSLMWCICRERDTNSFKDDNILHVHIFSIKISIIVLRFILILAFLYLIDEYCLIIKFELKLI
jgi:hypothetical protein